MKWRVTYETFGGDDSIEVEATGFYEEESLTTFRNAQQTAAAFPTRRLVSIIKLPDDG